MRNLPWILSVVVALVIPSRSFASAPCCEVAGTLQEKMAAGPLDGPPLSFQLQYSFTMMDRLREGTSERSLDSVREHTSYESIPTEMEMTRYTAAIGYRVLSRLRALVDVPYVHNTMDMTVDLGAGLGWEGSDMNPVSGLGDVTAVGLYRLWPAQAADRALTLGLGVKTPTGEYRKKGSSGRFLHAHMQPGTGSWDPLVSLRFEQAAASFTFGAAGTYQETTRNREGYRFGNSAAADLFARYDLLESVGVTTGFTYLHTGRATDRDGNYTNLASLVDDPANTGGDGLWVSAGLVWAPIRGASLDAKIQVPAWERVNGTQLVARYAVSVGLSVSL